MKNLAFAVVFLFGAVLVLPAMSAMAGEGGYCNYGAYKAVQAKKDVKEVEAEYAVLIQEAREDGKISDAEQANLDFYRLQNNINLARAKAIENSGS
jgi:hypothetical protein